MSLKVLTLRCFLDYSHTPILLLLDQALVDKALHSTLNFGGFGDLLLHLRHLLLQRLNLLHLLHDGGLFDLLLLLRFFDLQLAASALRREFHQVAGDAFVHCRK